MSSRTLAAIHVERQADDDRADLTISQHRSNRVEVVLERAPLDDPHRMRPHRSGIGHSYPDSATSEIKCGDWHRKISTWEGSLDPRPLLARSESSRRADNSRKMVE